MLSLLLLAGLLQQAAPPFTVERLGDGVFALVRNDPIAFANNANSLVVVGDSGVLVVDAQFTRRATRDAIAEIRRLTSQPVRYVVTTHWHDDHAGGNQVYRDSFPGVVFIAHANTRADLATLGASNRRQNWDLGRAFLARYQRLLDQGLGADSTPASPGERRAMESTVAIGLRYLEDAADFRETLPTLTFTERLTVHLGARTVEVRHFGAANTRGDAIVLVPDAGVVATGDLLVHPVPFAFGAFIAEWAQALDSVAALSPRAIVPGHGPVLRDDAYLRRVRAMLVEVVAGTREALARGDSLPRVRERVTLRQHRLAVAGDDPWLNRIFSQFFLDPAVARAFAQLSAAGAP